MSQSDGEAPVPFVDLGAINAPAREGLEAAFLRVLDNSDFGVGPEAERFEALLAEVAGVSHAIGVNSGTAALQLMLLGAGIGPGDEVIVPANTFFATAEAALCIGASVVLVDPDPKTALVGPDVVAAAVGPRTAAIIGVHLYGQAVDADGYREIANRHGVPFFEDAAQAIGGSWRGAPVGSLGSGAAFSFYPTKNLGALGQGGAVTTDDDDLAREVRLLRSHGEEVRYTHIRIGYNERLHGLQAAFLSAKLPLMDEAQRLRDAAVAQYHELLQDVDGVELLQSLDGSRHVHHLMVVKVDHRDRVLELLHRAGIGAAVHYPIPIHLQPACPDLAPAGSLPGAEELADTVLSLPLYPGMTEGQIERCVKELQSAVDAVAGQAPA